MFWRAKNGLLHLENSDMHYVSFGKGKNTLVMLPGLADGVTTVKGMAIPLALQNRIYAKDYKVYVFSRKNDISEGYSTRDMARDQAAAMAALGIKKACVLGVSQGGMIAQHLAADYPELVEKLVLAVTLSRQNDMVREVIGGWIAMAERADYKSIMIDISERSYSEKYLSRYRLLYPLLGRIGKPDDFSRFIIQANSCISHDSYEELSKIVCPTLVIGGDCDKIVGPEPSRELAGAIKNCKLIMYEGLGHAAYEEGKDFNQRVLQFLKSE
ncbi:MAG: alpha/beta hydrolase [Oscillospiraceae bacterium]|jgi:pimeloyl-ACP methyl ester carboxylesterase|nr:alpha/beta hydrolase [Oscillospiraceae bacterium]